jgi:hypothetical protein
MPSDIQTLIGIVISLIGLVVLVWIFLINHPSSSQAKDNPKGDKDNLIITDNASPSKASGLAGKFKKNKSRTDNLITEQPPENDTDIVILPKIAQAAKANKKAEPNEAFFDQLKDVLGPEIANKQIGIIWNELLEHPTDPNIRNDFRNTSALSLNYKARDFLALPPKTIERPQRQ